MMIYYRSRATGRRKHFKRKHFFQFLEERRRDFLALPSPTQAPGTRRVPPRVLRPGKLIALVAAGWGLCGVPSETPIGMKGLMGRGSSGQDASHRGGQSWSSIGTRHRLALGA